jgi:quercetin dioxygenase-like cupin family protein
LITERMLRRCCDRSIQGSTRRLTIAYTHPMTALEGACAVTDRRVTANLGRASLSNSGWYLNQLITFLATGEDTGERFALLRIHAVQGAEAPAHVHAHEDEAIYVLAGEMTISVSGEELHAHPGDIVTIPRGVEHALRHDSAEVTYLLQFSPAGFERYFHEMSEPAEYLGLPSMPVLPDGARMVATAARYGCIFTGRIP